MKRFRGDIQIQHNVWRGCDSFDFNLTVAILCVYLISNIKLIVISLLFHTQHIASVLKTSKTLCSIQLNFKIRYFVSKNCRLKSLTEFFLTKFLTASNMEPLAKLKRTFIWLGMCPASESASNKEKIAYILVARFVFSWFIFEGAAHLAYGLKFISSDLAGAVYSLLGFFILIETILNLIVAYFLQHRINATFEKLSTIYAASKSLLML